MKQLSDFTAFSGLRHFDTVEQLAPDAIEKRSMELISAELSVRKQVITEENRSIVLRVIHTTADFDYAETLHFSDHAATAARLLLNREKPVIITDTNMALAGINKKACRERGVDTYCFMSDSDIAAASVATGLTRAAVSIDKAAHLSGEGEVFYKRPLIFAIGNAPTALVRIRELFDAGYLNPAFIIGVPVGFVNVVAAKELLIPLPIPHIISRGQKGGSTVAAAICNALLYG